MDNCHNCPFLKFRYRLFLFITGFTRRDNRQLNAGQNTTFIYLFFAVPSYQRRKTFLLLFNSLAAITSSEKKCPDYITLCLGRGRSDYGISILSLLEDFQLDFVSKGVLLFKEKKKFASYEFFHPHSKD